MDTTLISRGILVALVMLCSACNWIDPYNDRFPLLRLGDSRSKVVAIMNSEPDSMSYMEIAGIRAERMSWHARPFGATYVVDCVAEHLVTKSASR